MSDQDNSANERVEQGLPSAESAFDDRAEAPAGPAPADPLLAMQQERDALYARLQRVSADYQNFMRRSQQNLVDSVDLAKGDLLKQLLPVLDHFDRAIDVQVDQADAGSLLEGVRIVRDELTKVLQQAGVEQIRPQVGQPFDPHRHEALMRQAASGVAPNHVSAVLQPGYVYRGRTLRAAKVAVAP